MQRDYVEEARNGDKEALNYLLDSHKNLAYSIAFKYVNDKNDAEDIVQEAFIKIFLNIKQFKSEAKFSTWLFKIVYNESLKLLQTKNKYTHTDISEVREISFEQKDALIEKDKVTITNAAMVLLNPNEYLVISLFYLAEKDVKEIAEISRYSISNIKVLLHRARKKMYDCLSRHFNDEVNDLL